MVRVVDRENPMRHLGELVAGAEVILRRLELPYQVMALCTGDLGFAMTKTYDLNAWAAGSGEWLEVSSISNANDYQARRANIRFRPEAGGQNQDSPPPYRSSLGPPPAPVSHFGNNQTGERAV